MNERIEKLMYDSGMTAQGCWDKFDEYDRQALNKFAELIILQCINICEHKGDAGLDGHYCVDEIKKHFGVK